jgi:Tfp pilus assembly protein PilZ
MRASRRGQKRITRRFPVRFGEQTPPQHVGFAKNLSLGGMEISCRAVFRSGTPLYLSIEPEKAPIDARGIVRWTTESDRMAMMAGLKSCMGIELTERPESYVDFVIKTADTFKERRKTPRFGKIVKVIFENRQQLIERYTHDISQGGIFVVSNDAPAYEATVELELVVAMTMAVIRVTGRVVYAITPEMAEAQGLNPGFAVQFIHFMDDGDKKLEEYIASLQYE